MSGLVDAPTEWRRLPIGRLFRRREIRGRSDLPLLSVYRDWGVVQRAGREDNYNKPGEDLDTYKHVQHGDLVLNKMKTWQGSLGVSSHEGIVSPAYFVAEPVAPVESRFIHHLLRSQPLIAEYGARSKGIRPSQWDLPWEEFSRIVVALPSERGQRAIADFLDAETARIDALIAKKRQVLHSLNRRRLALTRDLLRGAAVPGSRKPSGIPWLGDIPVAWTTPAVGHFFDVQLGRMLNQERVQGHHLRPYLRNANVGWGRVYLDDVAVMDFPPSERSRYLLQAGDLLVCEGGAGVAEAAVWDSVIEECYYQKSLHRVRPRGAWPVEWVAEWLRLWKAVGAHDAEGNLATIPHLTAEQFRAHRVPMPEPAVCRELLRDLHTQEKIMNRIAATVTRQVELLAERRQALITAAVTGQLEVPGVAAS